MIAWGYFIYSVIYRFLGTFIIVLVWNLIDPWPFAWWGWYFLITFLIIPGTMAVITAIWFGICGTTDLRRMFRALAERIASPLDNGRVEGNLSLADKAAMEKIEAEKSSDFIITENLCRNSPSPGCCVFLYRDCIKPDIRLK